jgi:HK97 family phage portal protein
MSILDRLALPTILPAPSGERAAVKATPRRWAYWRDGPEAKLDEAAAVEVKSGVMGISDALAAVLGLSEPGQVGSPGAALRAYEQSSAVAIPINLIAEHVGAARIVLENLDTGDVERKAPILDLLRRPHPNMPGPLFMEFVAKMYLIAGEVPIVAGGLPGRPPAFLRPLSPADCSPTQDHEFGWARSWMVTGPALRGVYAAPPESMGSTWQHEDGMRELRVVRAFSTKDASMFRGQSRLASASKDVRQQIEGANFNVSLLQNGGRPSLFIQLKNRVAADVFEEIKAGIRESFEGARNAGKIAITNGGELAIQEAKASVRDMEFSESQTRTAQTIAKIYKVPVVLLNMDAATFSNMETATLALWDDAIIPTANYLLAELGDWLFPRFKIDPREWRLTLDIEQVAALRKRRLSELRERATSGLESINEIRRSMPGREEVEGGDEILVSAAQQPLSMVAAELEALNEPLPPLPPIAPPTPATGRAPRDEPETDPGE